ncbi:general secretion pathway protein [Blastopirellula marina]|uniref:General secretion pathway protein n=1 Tax=Blastopirellula marina TaxID=124 RepID=A0A2S8F0V1_9BACT|nr:MULTISPECIES: secretin N-terminal domain-containing protein [Pirellulaceae]PQO25802.1 general secretion pathway protein [Blastopirellula marina]RCS43485.1 general secretion pathway protein [Bremerella cremea]
MYRVSLSLSAYCCVAAVVALLGQSKVWGQVEEPLIQSSTDVVESLPGDENNTEEVAMPEIDGKLRFSFRGASWREVLDWVAEAGDLSLYVDDVPTGSFTYSDSQYFTVDDAVTRLNLFLLPRGYTLVRKGQMLSVINLGDPRGLQQLNAMARVVSPQDLDQLNDHEVVKCFVKLGDIVPTEAINEMEPLTLMTTPVVLPRSNQLIITDTAKNLRSALQILESMKEPHGEEASIRRFDLKHVDAATVLLVASTHLGIPENDTSGIDITITTDTTGRRLYAVGSEDKLKRLDSLIQVVDVPEEAEEAPIEKTLLSHSVSGDNLQAVYDVLQTILADKSLRLSMQESSNSIVALADAETHQIIRDTIQELQAPSIEFSVVELNSVDPYFAVSLVAEMFGVSDEDDRDKKNEDRVPPPKVDADPGNRRLFVRGTAEQIQQIEKLIERLDSRKSSGTDLRFIPLTGPKRENLLQTAKKSWGGENCLQILPGDEATPQQFIERSLHNEEEQGGDDAQDVVPTNSSQEDLLRQPISPMRPEELPTDSFVILPEVGDTINTSATVKNANAPIRSQLVPNGILLQSDDIEALDRFEEHLRMLSAQDKNAISPTVIYYLKYVSADEAVKMLADLLDGGNALNDSPADTLVRGSVGNLGGYYGSLLFDRDGVTTVTAGTATIVSDARLNRLIVQGTREDIATIESYMRIIDKDSSITDIETSGRSRVIELKHARATEVAEMIREAFPDRVDMTTQQNAQARQAPPAQSENRGNSDDRRDDEQRGFQEKPTRGSKPTMAVAVHEASNSLVITAPDALFSEVEQLVASVDQRSERAVRVITATNGINLEMIEQVLAEQAGNSPRSSSSSRTRSSASSSSSRSKGR